MPKAIEVERTAFLLSPCGRGIAGAAPDALKRG